MLCDCNARTSGLVFGLPSPHMAVLAAGRSPRADLSPDAFRFAVRQSAAFQFSMKDEFGTRSASCGFAGSGFSEGMPERHEKQP